MSFNGVMEGEQYALHTRNVMRIVQHKLVSADQAQLHRNLYSLF
jgi:hypothetical protein